MINVPYLTSKQELELPRSQDTPVIGQKRKFKDQTTNDLPINADNKMHRCVDPDCAAMYCFQSGLQKHLAAGGHYYGSTAAIHTKKEREGWIPPKKRNCPERTNETMIKFIQDFSQHNSLMERDKETIMEEDTDDSPLQFQPFTSGQRYFQVGFGTLKSTSPSRRSLAQKLFLKLWLSRGEADVSTKASPERAEQWMTIVGTHKGEDQFPDEEYIKANPSGIATFKFNELLNCFQLKSYASKGSKYIDRLLKNEVEEDIEDDL